MKSSLKRAIANPILVAFAILLFALLAGTVRLRVVGHTEPEFWSTAFGELADATIGRIFDTTPVHKRKPMEQLEFWQPRIDKILADHPNDAELHAAAALIYDKPADGMSESASKIVLASEINAWDFGSAVITTIRNWITPYDQTATPLAMELSRRAVQLDPPNPQWLRLQAAISVQPLLYSKDSVSRSDLLKEAAEKAQTVDPDNGIYDLLIAENMITGSMQFDVQLADPGLRFVDRSAAENAREMALQAIRKPLLELGEPGWVGLNRIHQLAAHSKRGTMESMISRSTRLRLKSPMIELVRQLMYAGEVAERDGESDAVEFFLASKQVCEAILANGDKTFFPLNEYRMFHEITLKEIIRIQNLGPDSDEAKELQTVINETRAMQNALAVSPPTQRNRPTAWFATLLAMMSGVMLYGLMASAVPLLALAYLARQSATYKLSYVPWFALAVSVGLTTFFLGIGPAGHVSTVVQDWIALMVIASVVVVVVFGCAKRLGKRPQFQLKSLLIACTICAAVFTCYQMTNGEIFSALHLAGDPGMATIEAVAQLNSTGQNASNWIPGPDFVSSSLMQWLMKDGAAVSIWLALLITGCVGFVRGQLTKSIIDAATFTILMSLLALNVWVWSYPSLLPSIKARNDEIREFMSNPQAYYAELRQEYVRQLEIIDQEG